MGWLSRWFGGGALSNSDKGALSIGPNIGRTDSGIVVSNDKAMEQSTLWACCRLLTENVASTPLHFYERVNDNTRRRADDNPVSDLFMFAPNALMNPLEFREAMTLALVLWGNAYAHITRDKNGVPRSLMPLHPDRVTPTLEAGTVTYHYFTDNKEVIFAKESILHLKGFGIDGVVGLAPIEYARNALGISVSADRYASRAFGPNGRPAGFISIDKVLLPEQRKQLLEIYKNASVDDTATWVFEAGAKWNAIGVTPDEIQMLQSREFQISELSRFFLIPPHMIGAVTKSTTWGSGLEQQTIGFLTFVLRPYFNRWEWGLNSTMLTRTQSRKFYFEHSVEGFLRADSTARSAFYASAIQNGWMDRNEVRAKENLPPRDGAGELTAQVNMTPVAQLPGVANGNETPTD